MTHSQGPMVRRPLKTRLQRLVRHPIRTIQERRTNQKERQWEIYREAGELMGEWPDMARVNADILMKRTKQSANKSLRRAELLKSYRPSARMIQERQAIKEQIIMAAIRQQEIEDKISQLKERNSSKSSLEREQKARRRMMLNMMKLTDRLARLQRHINRFHGKQ